VTHHGLLMKRNNSSVRTSLHRISFLSSFSPMGSPPTLLIPFGAPITFSSEIEERSKPHSISLLKGKGTPLQEISQS